jgi:hypothetical protein
MFLMMISGFIALGILASMDDFGDLSREPWYHRVGIVALGWLFFYFLISGAVLSVYNIVTWIKG